MSRPLNTNDYMRIVHVMVYELDVKKEPYITPRKIAEQTLITKRRVQGRLYLLEQWGVVRRIVLEGVSGYGYVLQPRTAWADGFRDVE